jgi:hypothetical protein
MKYGDDALFFQPRTPSKNGRFALVVGEPLIDFFYLGRQDASAYGPAAALVLILVWVYYSAIILFLGAEFTCVWAERHGRPSVPAAGAVRIQSRSDVEGQARTFQSPSTV